MHSSALHAIAFSLSIVVSKALPIDEAAASKSLEKRGVSICACPVEATITLEHVYQVLIAVLAILRKPFTRRGFH